MKKQSFVFGAVILAISGIICKILGAVYKIPLTNILGIQGMGIYYLIFPIYAFLLTFTSSSFTMAISKYVSKNIAENKKLYSYKIFKASLILLVILGSIASITLCLLSKIIASLQGVENAYICYLIIAPSILVVAIICAFKGYFQGLQNMVPSAISQIIEQVFKLSIGFVMAKLFISKGVLFGAVGALFGITISEVFTCLFFIVYFFIFKSRNKTYYKFIYAADEEKKVKMTLIIKDIFKMSLPFTFTSVILPMSMVIDSFLIINILKSMSFEKAFATGLLGLNSGMINTLVGLPSTLSIAICMTIVPYITFALSRKDDEGINEKTVLAYKLTFIIAIPCTFVFAFFAPQIIRILYSSSFNNVYEYNVSSSLLMISSVNVLYLAFLQISTALLQAINKAYVPVISLSVALIFKVICEIVLIQIPSLNIFGAVISNSVCYLISSMINIYQFKKSVDLKFSVYQTLVSPLIASAVMVLIVYVLMQTFFTFLSYSISILFAFVLGACIYLLLIILLKTFTTKEQSSLLFFKRFKKEKQKT